jgi:hypothetical protein
MKAYYSIDVQMRGTYEADDNLLAQVCEHLGCAKECIEEEEVHSAKLCFMSYDVQSEMRSKVLRLLTDLPRIYYVDVVYIYEYETIPDRFVIWQGGKVKEYTGKVIFVEDDDE